MAGAQDRAWGAVGGSPAMTADAPVCFSAAAYLGLLKKVRSPAPASSIPATRWISMSPSPSRRQPSRSDRSRSFKDGIIQEFRRDALLFEVF